MTLAAMRRHKRWLATQGFTQSAAQMDKVIDTFTQEIKSMQRGEKT